MKTLAQAASMGPFVPGSSILLKAGDTWTNDPYVDSGVNAGFFDRATFASTYTSAFNTNNAAYIAGTLAPPNSLPTFSQFKTNLINAGESSGTADTDATEYCRRLAMADALVAAHRAAQATSKWITFGRYGSGANPVVDGNNTGQFGVDLSGSDFHYHGGWKIVDVDIVNWQVGGIRAETFSANYANALWLVSSTPGAARIDNITGVAFNAATHTLNTPIAGYSHFTAVGIDSVNTPYLFIEGYAVTNTDTPWFISGQTDGVVLNMAATTSFYLHPYAQFSTRHLVAGCTMDSMCTIGLSSGRAGYIFSTDTDAICLNCEIKNGTLSGNAFDLEGHDTNSSLFACHFHDYNGAAILDNSNTGQNTGTMIVGCTIDHCANVGTDTIANFIQTNPVTLGTDHLICVNNTIAKDPDQGFLFCGPTYSTSKTNTITDRITNGVFGPDNTVT